MVADSGWRGRKGDVDDIRQTARLQGDRGGPSIPDSAGRSIIDRLLMKQRAENQMNQRSGWMSAKLSVPATAIADLSISGYVPVQ